MRVLQPEFFDLGFEFGVSPLQLSYGNTIPGRLQPLHSAIIRHPCRDRGRRGGAWLYLLGRLPCLLACTRKGVLLLPLALSPLLLLVRDQLMLDLAPILPPTVRPAALLLPLSVTEHSGPPLLDLVHRPPRQALGQLGPVASLLLVRLEAGDGAVLVVGEGRPGNGRVKAVPPPVLAHGAIPAWHLGGDFSPLDRPRAIAPHELGQPLVLLGRPLVFLD
mmetsp:Transcript_24628/g.55736  ORF Transcript_24628/g.55736 Transcript_24628/m.55736 type:complete len:219 (-) Transcript_24628:474-1130(-)